MASEVGSRERARVARRARHQCEYCLIHEDDAAFPHQVDHIISLKHGGASVSENLAFACVICNRYKGSDIASVDPATGRTVALFDPRRDRWEDHFHLVHEFIEPLSAPGRVTVYLLRMNAPERLAERRLLQRLGRYPLG